MRYTLSDEFTAIAEQTGVMENIGGVTVEISDGTENKTGMLLYPRQTISFNNATMYAKKAAGSYGVAVIAVLPISQCGGGSSQGSDGLNIATDEEVAEMLHDVFGR